MTLSVFATPDNGKFVLRNKLKMKFNDHKNYIYYFDDKEITEEEIKGIDPSVIGAMTIFKGDKAVAKYGEKGENGIIISMSKKNEIVQATPFEFGFVRLKDFLDF